MENGFVASVFKAVLINNETNNVIGTTTLQEGQIDVKVQENDIRGGDGDALLGTLHSQRDINITLTDVAWKPEFVAEQLGQDIVVGEGIGYAMPTNYTVSGSTITLDNAPLTSDPMLSVYNSDGIQISGATISGSSVDFSTATPTVADSDVVEVRTYKYNTDAQTQTIEFDESVFAKGMTVALQTLEISGQEIPLATIQYQFDNAVPGGNFTIDTKSQKQATTQQFALKVVKPSGTTKVGRLMRIPIAS